FVAGPGFSLALGSTVSPAAAAPGLLPLVPVLGAVPEAADYPSILYAVLVLPVAAGVFVGWRVDRELEFFGNLRARVSATVVAGLIAVVVVVAVTALGNGAVGVDRLRGVGVPLLALFLALAAEVLLGALAWLGIAVLRERHKDKKGGSATTQSTDAAEGADGVADTDHTGATDDADNPAQRVATTSARNAGGRSGGTGGPGTAGDTVESARTDAAVGTLDSIEAVEIAGAVEIAEAVEIAGAGERASESAKTSPESSTSAVS
ncbi:MAG TPA: DUF6350 family protein, partial [Humibacillus xanthopallidus]|nr:DUF6350 family protein [Humibacillus xanthopallidus]